MLVTLPNPPSLAELTSKTPPIAPVPNGVERPFWSVMIPTYNCTGYLRRTLASVLAQDPGPEQMQIEVVDDCSTKDDPEAVVQEVGKGRVSFFRQPSNQGATRTFNTCLDRSVGRWIHILHGDDMVQPGYYEGYRCMINHVPGLSMVFGRAELIDPDDRPVGLSELISSKDNQPMGDFLSRQSIKNLVSFPSAVVARSAYEQTGGFCHYFHHIADMDMWFRAGQVGKVIYASDPRCCYRIHGQSDTSRIILSATNIRELYSLIPINLLRLGVKTEALPRSWVSDLAAYAEGLAWGLISTGHYEGGYNQARWAWGLEPNFRRFRLLCKMWLKHKLSRRS
jgi:glycosyltransferase involved in cell wall biosynthesis